MSEAPLEQTRCGGGLDPEEALLKADPNLENTMRNMMKMNLKNIRQDNEDIKIYFKQLKVQALPQQALQHRGSGTGVVKELGAPFCDPQIRPSSTAQCSSDCNCTLTVLAILVNFEAHSAFSIKIN
ncbi:hypothetical protein SFRURICE_005629 [Spodoptera frugiperda]|nr:hypothetical protein SFRURICE_005629 [Spodoptera frugiperda]